MFYHRIFPENKAIWRKTKQRNVRAKNRWRARKRATERLTTFVRVQLTVSEARSVSGLLSYVCNSFFLLSLGDLCFCQLEIQKPCLMEGFVLSWVPEADSETRCEFKYLTWWGTPRKYQGKMRMWYRRGNGGDERKLCEAVCHLNISGAVCRTHLKVPSPHPRWCSCSSHLP